MKRLRPVGRRGRTCCYPSITVKLHENQEYHQHVGQIEKEHGSKSKYKNGDNARNPKPLMPACRDKRIQEGSVRKGPSVVQHLRHATKMQGKKVWAKISAEEKSQSLVYSAQFAFHTRKKQHHIDFGFNQVLKNAHDSKLSLELIILCFVVSPFQSLWFIKHLEWLSLLL